MKTIDELVLREKFENKETIRSIAKYFQCSEHTIYKKLDSLNLKREKLVNIIDIKNQRYNKLVALEYIRNDKFGKAIWKFRCDCGKEKELNASAAKANLTTSCGCVKANNLRKNGYELLSSTFFKKLQKSALSRNYDFDLDMQYMWDLFIKQNKKCALSGVDITIYPDSNRERLQTASPDRIDSNKGYTKDNFQWVHKRVNRLKNVLKEDELLFWCKKIIENNKDKTSETYDVNILTWD